MAKIKQPSLPTDIVMDKIFLRDLRLNAIIGTYPEERVTKQDIILNVELRCDLRKAGRSDCLHDTVNYVDIEQRIIRHVENSNFHLIEALAESVADICLETEGVASAKVTLDKPHALQSVRSVAVEIER